MARVICLKFADYLSARKQYINIDVFNCTVREITLGVSWVSFGTNTVADIYADNTTISYSTEQPQAVS